MKGDFRNVVSMRLVNSFLAYRQVSRTFKMCQVLHVHQCGTDKNN